MDYLYGKLNREVEKVLYKGLTTETAEVIVNNVDSTISVNVIKENVSPLWGTWS